MARSQKEINIIITAENKRLKKDLAKAKSMIKKQGDKAGKSWSDGFLAKTKTNLDKSMGSLLGNIGANAASKALGFLTGAFGAVLSEAREFSKQVANINTLLSKTNRVSFNTTKQFTELAGEFGTSRGKQARAYYDIVSAGVDGLSERMGILKQANIAALAGLSDIQTTTRSLVGVMNAYAGSNITVEQASDQMFLAVKRGLTTFEELSESIGRVTPMAAAAGMSFGELTGTLAFLTKKGIRTDEAVTGLRGILRAIIKPAAETVKVMDALQLKIGVTELQTHGTVEIFRRLKKATGGSAEVLGKLFPRVQALTSVLPILNGNLDDYVKIINEAKDASGETAEAAGAFEEELDRSLRQAEQSIDNFSGSFMTAFGNPAVIMLANITKALGDLATASVNASVKQAELRASTVRYGGTAAAISGQWKQNFVEITSGAADTKKFLDKLTERTKGSGLMSPFAPTGADGKTDQENEAIALQRIKFKEEQDAFRSHFDTLKNSYLNFGLTKAEIITANYLKEKEILDESKRLELVSESEYQERLNDIRERANKKRIALETDATQIQKNLAGLMKGFVVNTMAGAFERFADTLVKTKNGFSGFFKDFMGMLGTLAMEMGKMIVGAGIAKMMLEAAPGAATIAAGASLMAIGALIKSKWGDSGEGTGATSGAGVGGTAGTTIDQDLLMDDEDEREEKGASVTLNVQGDILDSEDTGTRLITLLNDAFDTKGAMITQNIG